MAAANQSEGTVKRAMSKPEKTLGEDFIKLLLNYITNLKRIKMYEVDLTLDPDTAYCQLNLSDDGKQVNWSDVKKQLPDNPKRFYNYGCVLAKQSFSSGRFYYEVEVQGKTEWTLGVVQESIARIGYTKRTPENGYWMIMMINGNQYRSYEDPQKVGVFVDVEAGLVCFYDADTEALIYSFTGCSFTENLFPFFDPGSKYPGGENSPPLIICSGIVKVRSDQTSSFQPET